jgi:chromosome segregation ATPase
MHSIEQTAVAAKSKITIIACEMQELRALRAGLQAQADDLNAKMSLLDKKIEAKSGEVGKINEFLAYCEVVKEQAEGVSSLIHLDKRPLKRVRQEKEVTITDASIPEWRTSTPPSPATSSLKLRIKSSEIVESIQKIGREFTVDALRESLEDKYGVPNLADRTHAAVGALLTAKKITRVGRGAYRLVS